MSYEFYKALHVFGVVLLFTSLGAFAHHSATGGTKSDNPRRKVAGATHGIALLLVLIAGFGAAGKGGWMSQEFPLWIAAKLVIWLFFGAAVTALGKRPGLGSILWWVLPIVGGLAGAIAIYKPF
jgi:hypothetical protein